MSSKPESPPETPSALPVANEGPNPSVAVPLPEPEEMEIIQASIKAGSVAQIVVAAIAVLGLIYILKLVLITTLTSLLLAFFLEPLVGGLCRLGIRRWAGALFGVVLMVALAIGLTFFFYSRAIDFATTLPKYSGKIRDAFGSVRSQSKKLEEA